MNLKLATRLSLEDYQALQLGNANLELARTRAEMHKLLAVQHEQNAQMFAVQGRANVERIMAAYGLISGDSINEDGSLTRIPRAPEAPPADEPKANDFADGEDSPLRAV